MTHKTSSDLPRVSGRQEGPGAPDPREPQKVFRRFFDLLERFDKPGGGPPTLPNMKSHPRNPKIR